MCDAGDKKKSQCKVLKSCASQIFDFTPLFSTSEQGTIIGIAGRAYNSGTSRQGYTMQSGAGAKEEEEVSSRWRDREWAGRVVKTVKKIDNSYIIFLFLAQNKSRKARRGWAWNILLLCLAVVLHRTLFIICWEFTRANNKALTNEQSPCQP